ncbi:MAG: response regulator [Candidatus Obscuribacterales bacterium]|nr:response regulator [Candidatus Obscuribacterales bacterium]
MSTPAEHLENLRREIAAMEETKRLTKQAAEERLKQLSSLADRLRSLNESAPSALGQLSKVLGAAMADKNVGVMVVGPDGRVLLFNAAIQKLLGLQLGETPDLSRNMGFGFFMEDKITPCPSGFLAWERFQEERSQKLYVQHPKVPDGIWVQIRSLPLMDESNDKGGAVAIVNDITEQVKVEQEIQNICNTLEHQVSIIETAQNELNQLASKLGNPQWELPPEAAKEETAAGEVSPESEVIKLLLVVDDIPVNRKLLSIQLQKLGYEVDQAEDGKPALEMVKKKQYGLVFMDLDMPELDGFQTSLAIRQYDRESNQHTPVVAMTSYDREGDREKCLSHGMDDYLSKGITKKRLQEVIDRCIRHKVRSAPAKAANLPPPEEPGVLVDIKLLQQTYGVAETAEIINLFTGTMRTLVGCLRFAIDEQDAKSVNHFAYSFKGPCATLGLHSMARLTAGITSDAESGNWQRAMQGLLILEAQCKEVMEQLAPYNSVEEFHSTH